MVCKVYDTVSDNDRTSVEILYHLMGLNPFKIV